MCTLVFLLVPVWEPRWSFYTGFVQLWCTRSPTNRLRLTSHNCQKGSKLVRQNDWIEDRVHSGNSGHGHNNGDSAHKYAGAIEPSTKSSACSTLLRAVSICCITYNVDLSNDSRLEILTIDNVVVHLTMNCDPIYLCSGVQAQYVSGAWWFADKSENSVASIWSHNELDYFSSDCSSTCFQRGFGSCLVKSFDRLFCFSTDHNFDATDFVRE